MLKSPPPGVAQMLQAFRPVLEREVFLLGGVRSPVPRWPLMDFFDGLETAELLSRVDRSPALDASRSVYSLSGRCSAPIQPPRDIEVVAQRTGRGRAFGLMHDDRDR